MPSMMLGYSDLALCCTWGKLKVIECVYLEHSLQCDLIMIQFKMCLFSVGSDNASCDKSVHHYPSRTGF